MRAKALLDRKGVAYEEIDAEHDDALRAWLVEATGQRTVPQIFVGDRSLGGFSDIDALDREGKLDAILRGEADAPHGSIAYATASPRLRAPLLGLAPEDPGLHRGEQEWQRQRHRAGEGRHLPHPHERRLPPRVESSAEESSAPPAEARCCTADCVDWNRARSEARGTRDASVESDGFRTELARMKSTKSAQAGSSGAGGAKSSARLSEHAPPSPPPRSEGRRSGRRRAPPPGAPRRRAPPRPCRGSRAGRGEVRR